MNTAEPVKDFDALLANTLLYSRYVQRMLGSDPNLREWLQQHCETPGSVAEMQAQLESAEDETELSRAVRRLRKRVMCKLILRDINGLADLPEVMHTMTMLAEVCVRRAQHCLMRVLRSQFGAPIGADSQLPQELLIIGMGKLGGGELNVSSDIDLIFVYAEDGETNGPRQLSNHEFFTRLGRRLINLINELTADGYVFRVDMRLRPYGDSGPLVMSFAALEEYLVSQGREWERYAWIKARVIAPEAGPHIAELAKLAQPFVFRKYLDFGAIDSMRKLHAQIRQEVQRRDRMNNIKLGPGGIREIEFTAQVFQLIRGGRDSKLRIRPTRQVLRILADNRQLDAAVAADLDVAYVFLRNLEHRLQYLEDQQTQELPENPEDRHTIAQAMGFPDFATFMVALDVHRNKVSEQFEHIFGEPEQAGARDAIALDGLATSDLAEKLARQGYRAATRTAEQLQQLRGGSRYRQLPDSSRQRLDRLIPQFITLAAHQNDPDTALQRLLALLESISRRASYIAFLTEYPDAAERLVKIMSASRWASNFLTQHPSLLDELLDAREIYQAPDWATLETDIRQRLQECDGDAERQLEVLHQTQQEQTFHLLAMDLQGLLPVEKLSDHLSDLADLILRHILDISWLSVRKKHRDIPRFAIVSYGKLGGKELGYASDLDMIFLYDDDHPDAQEIYSRLAQRINALLGTHTASGRLYETDLRLRPNGASGLLVSSIAAFEDYQQQQAWVWEHQALTRARFSAGDPSVGGKFSAIRESVLRKPRDQAALQREIIAMRQKMRDGHPNDSGLFDIKHDRGGMVDIEFMVQYLVLAYAERFPQLTANIGNLALLKLAAELQLITDEFADKIRALYRELRRVQHRMRLNSEGPCRINFDEIDTTACKQLWELLLHPL